MQNIGGGNIVWVTPTDLGKLQNKYISKSERNITEEGYNSANTNMIASNSIILSTRAPIGHIAVNTVDLCTNQGCKGIIPNTKLTADYLYYYLIYHKEDLQELGSGATFKELSTTALRKFIVQLPPLEDQHRIVAQIEFQFACIDKTIAAVQSQLDTIKAMPTAILRAELNDKGDPIYAKENC